MAGREFSLPSDEQVTRDRELIEALEEHQSVGEKYARTGEIPETVHRDPSMGPSANAELTRDPTPVRPLPTPPRFVGRRIVQIVIAVALIAVGYYAVTLWQVWSTGRADESRNVDAIVVLGAAQYDGRPSPQLAARLDHVVDLWAADLAAQVVVTGGNQEGDRFTEASASAQYLVERGVPASAIVQEDAGTTTFDSLERASFAARWLRRDRSDRDRSVPCVAQQADGARGGFHRVRLVDARLGGQRFGRVAPRSGGGRRCRGWSDHRVRTVEWPHRLRPIQSRPAPVVDSSSALTPWGVV